MDNTLINHFRQHGGMFGDKGRPAAYADESRAAGQQAQTRRTSPSPLQPFPAPRRRRQGGLFRHNTPDLLTTEYTEGAEVSRFSAHYSIRQYADFGVDRGRFSDDR